MRAGDAPAGALRHAHNPTPPRTRAATSGQARRYLRGARGSAERLVPHETAGGGGGSGREAERGSSDAHAVVPTDATLREWRAAPLTSDIVAFRAPSRSVRPQSVGAPLRRTECKSDERSSSARYCRAAAIILVRARTLARCTVVFSTVSPQLCRILATTSRLLHVARSSIGCRIRQHRYELEGTNTCTRSRYTAYSTGTGFRTLHVQLSYDPNNSRSSYMYTSIRSSIAYSRIADLPALQ